MDDLAKKEQDKYARIWARPEYSRWSPGEESAGDALKMFNNTEIATRPIPHDLLGACTVTEYGCGQGKAMDIFLRGGYDAIGYDIVKLSERADIIEVCMWDLPSMIPFKTGAQFKSDFAYCADVMEHIPPERVSDVLKAIAERTETAAYFRICMVHDGCGALINEALHLTVQPAAWWHEELTKHFAGVQLLRIQAENVFFICKP